MAKVRSPKQKEDSSKATKDRNAAFRARRTQYQKGVAEAEREADNSSYKAAYEQASAAREKLLEDRNRAEDEIRAQIKLLNEKLEKIKEEYNEKFRERATEVRSAWKALDEHKKALIAEKTAGLEDVANCYRASLWNPPSDLKLN